MTKTLLIREPSQFFCYQDEWHFFSWLEGLPSFKGVVRTQDGLALTLDWPVSDESLADLIGVLSRYDLDRSCLRELRTPQNEHWFADPKAFWHGSVFGKQ